MKQNQSEVFSFYLEKKGSSFIDIFHFYSDKLLVNPGEHKQMVLKISCPNINYLEHTLITLTIEAPNRGQLEIAIKSQGH